MKKILFISIIAILLANSIMAGGTKEEATLDQLGRIKEKGEITIAMEGTWAPWTYHNEKDELVGYDTEVGKAIAEAAVKQGITEVVFDRGGYIYHGRIKALAEGAREGGLKF